MTASAETDAAELTTNARPVVAEDRRRWGWLALTVALVFGLLLGYAGGLLTPHYTKPGDDSPEAGFARDMTTHHAQAVEMSLIIYRTSEDESVRQIAVDIATSQQGEIGMMQSWLREWGLGPTGSQPVMAWMPNGEKAVKNGLMPGMASPEEIEQLQEARGREADILFLELMIKHHLGGVHMINEILPRTKIDSVIDAVTRMKNVQQNELNNLNAMLQRLKSAD